jgi:hypothetical protein
VSNPSLGKAAGFGWNSQKLERCGAAESALPYALGRALQTVIIPNAAKAGFRVRVCQL